MKSKEEIRDDARMVLRKFRDTDRPDKGLFDQLRCLPDEVISELQDEFSRDKTVKDIANERGLGNVPKEEI
jgi:hypothetical protein